MTVLSKAKYVLAAIRILNGLLALVAPGVNAFQPWATVSGG
jgi:hypothetical protein